MAEIVSNPLLALVKEMGMIDDLQLEEVQEEVSRSGKPMAQVLSDLDVIPLDQQLDIIADHLGTEVVDLKEISFEEELLKTIPATTARMYQVLPVTD
jgi:hypothetical protein